MLILENTPKYAETARGFGGRSNALVGVRPAQAGPVCVNGDGEGGGPRAVSHFQLAKVTF